jgi:predicted O-linked N-acetylglucosamine transferase (SPINDLY family)
MLYIIISNFDQLIITNIQYIFIGFKHIIITQDKIDNININNDDYLLFINNFISPLRNFQFLLKNIIKSNIDFSYLSNCKNIYIFKYSYYLTNKNNFNHLFNILFDSFNVNNIDNIIIPEQITTEYIIFMNIFVKSYQLITSKPFSYNCYNMFLKNVVKKNICYHIIVFIQSKQDLFNFILKKFNHRFIRFTVFHNLIDPEYTYYIETFCKKNKILLFYVANNFQKFFNIIYNNSLWFEKIILYKNNINDIDLTFLNKYHNVKSTILLDNVISVSSSNFILISYFGSNKLSVNSIFNLSKKYVYNNVQTNSYIKNLSDKFIKNSSKIVFIPKINPDMLQKHLMKVRNYLLVIESINEQIKNNYDNKNVIRLLSKKVSISVLCKNSTELLNDVNIIINTINDLEYLSDLFLLFSSLQNQKIINQLCIKVLKLSNDNKISKITILCFKKLLNHNMDIDELTAVIDFITLIKDKNILTKDEIKQILIGLFLSVGKYIENKEIIDKFNKLIFDIFNENDILNIDDLLKINYSNNKICLLHFLITLTTNFSAYYNTYDEFLQKRNKIKNNINTLLLKDLPNCNLDQVILLPVSNFYLSYQGISSKEIFELKSKLMRKICPELNYVSNRKCNNEKIKICFLSNFLNRTHSVYKDRHQIIKNMSFNNKFDIYFATFEDLISDVKYTFGNAKHIKLNPLLSIAKNEIENYNFDILVYCEIGMDPKPYYLAHMKLAPIQINTWGHSDTCGINTIDYFFSSKLYELDYEQAQTHYSEKLILLDSLCTSYNNPILKYNINLFKKRYEFGFTDEVIIYFCAQSLFKFNPLFDDYIIDILQKNQKSILIILNNDSKTQVLKRYNNKNITNRIHIFPMMQHFLYMNLIYISDIILDPYPFGGCNSSLEAFSMNKVVVTHESDMINGRFTSGFYKKMGLNNLICKTKKDYINLANKLTNTKFRNNIENKIKQNNSQLFNDNDSINEWTNKIIELKNNHNT